MRTGTFFFHLGILGCIAALGGIALVLWQVVPSDCADALEVTVDLRAFSEGIRVLKDSLAVARDLTLIEPGAGAGTLEARRERAAYQKGISTSLRTSLAASGHYLDALGYLPMLLEQSEGLLEMAAAGSPSRPVSPEQAAAAPVLSMDPNVTGVLPGTRRLVAELAEQLRNEAETLTKKAEQEMFNRCVGAGGFAGLSPRRWMMVLAAPCLLAVLCIMIGLRYVRWVPERLVEAKIRAASRRDPRKGIDLCHKEVGRLLDLAERMTRQMGG